MGEGMAAAEAWAALSLARLQLGDADRALAAAEAARSLDPTAAYPNAVLAAAAVGVGSFDLAIEAASSAAAHPGSSYLDRAIAASAAALANGAIGDDAAADASIAELEADAQSTVDPVCQLLVELTKSHLDRVRTATPAETIEDVAPGWRRAVATMALGAASVHR